MLLSDEATGTLFLHWCVIVSVASLLRFASYCFACFDLFVLVELYCRSNTFHQTLPDRAVSKLLAF